MAVAGDRGPSARTRSGKRASFELERFWWAGEDRLELLGRFVGLGDVAPGDTVLVVRGAERTYHLPALPDGSSASPVDGAMWRAAFSWDEAPTPFQSATLVIGSEHSVELPEPRAKRRPFGRVILDVQRAGADRASSPPEDPELRAAAERLRRHAELLVAQQDARELRSAARQTSEELSRARADLEAERRLRKADAERFGDALARLRARAEDAIGAHDALVAELRAELERARAEPAELRMALEQARHEAESARAEAARLRSRLDAVHEALSDDA